MPTKYEEKTKLIEDISKSVFASMFEGGLETPWNAFERAFQEAATPHDLDWDSDFKQAIIHDILAKIEFYRMRYGRDWRQAYLLLKER